jgi:hypothetical protein
MRILLGSIGTEMVSDDDTCVPVIHHWPWFDTSPLAIAKKPGTMLRGCCDVRLEVHTYAHHRHLFTLHRYPTRERAADRAVGKDGQAEQQCSRRNIHHTRQTQELVGCLDERYAEKSEWRRSKLDRRSLLHGPYPCYSCHLTSIGSIARDESSTDNR